MNFHQKTLAIIKRGQLELSERAAYPFRLSPQDEVTENEQMTKEHTRNNFMLFHFAMWLLLNPEIMDFRVAVDVEINDSPISSHRSAPIWIVFGKRRDRTVFSNWLKKYSRWFTGRPMDRAFFPFIPSTGRHSLSFLDYPVGPQFSHSSFDMEFPTDSIEKWSWVLANCRRPVYVTPLGLAFDRMKEGMLFKLRWG